jgi:hypothetical protein
LDNAQTVVFVRGISLKETIVINLLNARKGLNASKIHAFREKEMRSRTLGASLF